MPIRPICPSCAVARMLALIPGFFLSSVRVSMPSRNQVLKTSGCFIMTMLYYPLCQIILTARVLQAPILLTSLFVTFSFFLHSKTFSKDAVRKNKESITTSSVVYLLQRYSYFLSLQQYLCCMPRSRYSRNKNSAFYNRVYLE